MTAPLPAAVLWDFDGTLVDTHPLWFAAESRLAARQGGTWNETHSLRLNGVEMRAARRTCASTWAWTRLRPISPQRRGRAVGGRAPWRDGALELRSSACARPAFAARSPPWPRDR
ncbi:MAG: hypothetical protein U0838_00470 [Chloroflexota bacterium]